MQEQIASPSGAAFLLPWERRLLLEEIGSIALALGREQEPALTPPLPLSPEAVTGQKAATSPLERLRLLASLWQEIPAALSALLRRPDSLLQRESVALPLSRARGGAELAQRLARSPEGQTACLEAARFPSDVISPDRMVAERRSGATRETPANRFVVGFLETIRTEAEALARLADLCEERQEAERIAEVAAAAKRWRRHPVLAGIAPLAAKEQQNLAGISALHASPPYRKLFSLWRHLHAGLRFDWAGSPCLALAPLEAWHLYEIWCFLQVAQALRQVGWRCDGGDALRLEREGLRLMLTKGQASRLRFVAAETYPMARPIERRGKRGKERLELFYQPLFLSANRDAVPAAGAAPMSGEEKASEGGFASLTHTMQPDIGLCREGRWLLLDPKFRTYTEPGAEQADVDKMHTYRDAIVRRSSRHRAVTAAWCLFPGEAAEEIALQTAIRAYPVATAERPFGAAGIGALRLRPGDPGSAAGLEQWLKTETMGKETGGKSRSEAL